MNHNGITKIIFSLTLFCTTQEIITAKSYPVEYRYRPELTKKLYKIMQVVHDVLSKNNVPYFAIGGTLLGAIRDGEIIPWDDDLDIGILEKDLVKLNELAAEFNKRGVEFSRMDGETTPGSGLHTFYKIAHKQSTKLVYGCKYPWLDIFVFAELPDDRIVLHPNGPGAGLKLTTRFWLTQNELFPLKLHKLGKIDIYIPNQPQAFLDRAYKNWQTTYAVYSHA